MRFFTMFLAISVASQVFAAEVFEPGATLKVVAGAGAGGEGPAWHPQLGVLSSGNGHIMQLTPDGKSRVFREEAGPNGLLFDKRGRLIACEPKLRRVTRRELDGTLTVLTDRYEGQVTISQTT